MIDMVKKNLQIQKFNSKKTACAVVKNKPVSLKYVLEAARIIKGKRVDDAIDYLKRVESMREHLPLRVYRGKVAHRKGEAKNYTKAGRYPVKVAKALIELLELAKSNADFKGLDSENLLIMHMFASQGFRRASYQTHGRISGKRRLRKSCHIEVVVMEAR
jgi:large subunit ribosomal protein L22